MFSDESRVEQRDQLVIVTPMECLPRCDREFVRSFLQCVGSRICEVALSKAADRVSIRNVVHPTKLKSVWLPPILHVGDLLEASWSGSERWHRRIGQDFSHRARRRRQLPVGTRT